MKMKIQGSEARRVAARDGLTVHDGDTVYVVPVGWTGTGDDVAGYNVGDYFRRGEYLGPDEYGIEPTWRDA